MTNCDLDIPGFLRRSGPSPVHPAPEEIKPETPTARADDVGPASVGQSNLSDEKITEGQAALKRLHGDQTFDDWCKVGVALQVLRTKAMHDAYVNVPAGKNYNAALGAGLKRYGFDAIDKGDRSRLFALMDNITQIKNWRDTLPLNVRLSLNHPSSVIRRWRSATQVPNQPKLSAYAKLQAAHAETLEKLHRAEEEIARGGGDLWTADSTPRIIARIIAEKVSPNKAEKIARELLKRLRSGGQP